MTHPSEIRANLHERLAKIPYTNHANTKPQSFGFGWLFWLGAAAVIIIFCRGM